MTLEVMVFLLALELPFGEPSKTLHGLAFFLEFHGSLVVLIWYVHPYHVQGHEVQCVFAHRFGEISGICA